MKRPSRPRCLALALIALAGACLAALSPGAAAYDGRALALALHAAAQSASDPRERTWLAVVYAMPTPVWFTASGARGDVATALDALRRADERGLDPGDYHPSPLQREVDAAGQEPAPPDVVATVDVALTLAVLHYASDLRFGRVSPAAVAPHFRRSPGDDGFPARLREAVAAGHLNQALAAATPRLALYGRLERLLAAYRALAREPLQSLPPLPPGKTVHVGDHYDGVGALDQRLRRYGDLAPDVPPPRDRRYSSTLADGVRVFQARHGLLVDGALGKDTLAALEIPPARRVTQIALALERLRWLPDFGAAPLVAINIPSFRMWAFADASQAEPAFSMAVIVGRAMRNETPVFIGEMRAVEFHPYWNVPRSIVRDELLPKIANDRGFLRREDMELVGSDGRIVTDTDDAAIASLAAGTLRVRQRPGPKNALGRIKFVLPNAMDVYLHDTPARQLFGHSRRDFSHGCIRVGDPLALAEFVLGANDGWSRAAIDAALNAETHRFVQLARRVQVVVFYTTAVADRRGRALFMRDIYGEDRKLLEALRRASAGSARAAGR